MSNLVTWRVWSYDVWGNAEDGYEVNNRFSVATVREKADLTDADAIRLAQRVGLLSRGANVDTVTVAGDDFTIEFEDAEDGFPLGSLVREE